MIFVNRNRVENPFFVNQVLAKRAEAENRKAEDFYTPSDLFKQQRFPFEAYRDTAVLTAVKELFSGKCAYCESPILTRSDGGVEPFRPLHSVIEEPDHPGYWWLANSWDNLMYSCAGCSQNSRAGLGHIGKGGRFPLREGSVRAKDPSEVSREQPLLLSPTDASDISENFGFDLNGLIFGHTDEATEMIKVFALNRFQLVAQRRELLLEFGAVFDAFVDTLVKGDTASAKALEKQLLRMKEPNEPYSEMMRQALELHLEHARIAPKLAGKTKEENQEERKFNQIDPDLTPLEYTQNISQERRRSTVLENSRYDLSDANPANLERYREENRPIENILIKNFRGISSLQVSLSLKKGERMPWKVLLGENGEGKSTILQAIAITLAGPNVVSDLVRNRIIDGELFLRNGAEQGSIEIAVKGFRKPFRVEVYADRLIYQHPATNDPLVLRFETAKDEKRFDWPVSLVLLGYGATRLLPTHCHKRKDSLSFLRVENLFDPYCPLIDAEEWMTDSHRKKRERWEAEEILRDLMSLDRSAKFDVQDGKLILHDKNQRIPCSQWSSGYQAIFALTIDLIQTLIRAWPNLRHAEGIILIDELDAHLHPSWQIRIVDALRRAFPGIQIFASTHQPLCLRGLQEDEVSVLFRDPKTHEIEIQTNLPPTEGMRTDQILKSEYFGLYTTDPNTDAKIFRYQSLAMQESRSASEAAEMQELQAELEEKTIQGESALEQLMLQALRANNLDPIAPIAEMRRKPRKELLRQMLKRVRVLQAELPRPPEGSAGQ